MATLHRVGFMVHREGNLAEILSRWPTQPADLLIAAFQGNELTAAVAQIRAVTVAPLILIVHQVDEDQQVALLKMGADQIVTRPYSARILLAYAQNLVRRGRALPLAQLPRLHIGDLRIDPLTRRVTLDDTTSVILTAREFQLFYLLYNHRGQILTHDQIIEKIWGWNEPAETGTLRTQVSRLRTKLKAGTKGPIQIDHVAGAGYTMILNESVKEFV